jgi:ABC-2 type transport system permease protein
MSTGAITLEPVAGRASDRRPGLGRLAAVELRKMVDTRASFWLLLGVVALTITFVVVSAIIGDAKDHTLLDLLEATTFPTSVLLPVVGILLVSSEWSQRTTLITFALVPQRSRVLAAKLFAGLALSVVAMAMSLGFAAVGTAGAAPGVDGTWSVPPEVLGQEFVLIAASMIMGIGFGAMLLSSPPAIVLAFGLPLAFSAVSAIPGLEGVTRWLDGTQSLAPMSEHVMDATEWARAGTTLAVWMLLPLLIGLRRIVRGEIR